MSANELYYDIPPLPDDMRYEYLHRCWLINMLPAQLEAKSALWKNTDTSTKTYTSKRGRQTRRSRRPTVGP